MQASLKAVKVAHAHAHSMLSAYNWNRWHTGSEGLAFFPWADSSTEIQQSVVLAFTLGRVPIRPQPQKATRRLSSKSDDTAAPCPQAELSCRPLHQGWPRASESESASAKRWMKQQSCLGRRSLRSWAAVPSVLRPRPPNEYVASK